MSITRERFRSYWDTDAATYDNAAGHAPRTALEIAAWSAAMAAALPAEPARVLDVGAGTGFLSLLAARLGHHVVAFDFSGQMLDRLAAKARSEGLGIQCRQGDAQNLGSDFSGEFDAVVSRHLLWTLPEPVKALREWRAAAPRGTLSLFESLWGTAAPRREQVRSRLRHVVAHKIRGVPHDHHADYDDAMSGALPYSGGISLEALVGLVTDAGWKAPRIIRLTDVEAMTRACIPLPERLLGAAPRYRISADA